jgi:hypothetical protein
MVQAGKIDYAIQEIKRMKIEILGISEMRWSELEDIKKVHKIIHSYSAKGRIEHGVGVITSKTVRRSVTKLIPISDRVLLFQV